MREEIRKRICIISYDDVDEKCIPYQFHALFYPKTFLTGATVLNFNQCDCNKKTERFWRRLQQLIVSSFVTSKLDINNGLLYGLPGYRIKCLQHGRNAAVRLITGKGRFDHITPTRQSIHWLPVKSRVIFKICLLVYKCLNRLAPQYLIDCLSELKNPC